MFKSMKSKIMSFLLVMAALTQTGKAEQSAERLEKPQNQQELVMSQKEQSKKESIPMGDVVGSVAAGLLAAFVIIRSESYSRDDKYIQNILKKIKENDEQRQATESSVKGQPDAGVNRQPQSGIVPRIKHKEVMSQEERDLLATRLHAVRLMEDIKRYRAQLTRQMVKAKEENNVDKIQEIKSYRRALSAIRKEAFEQAMGPVAAQIKDERRLLTKKMALAKKRKETALMEEITQRRTVLKQTERVAKLSVREFSYKKERSHFIKRKSALSNAAIFVQQNCQNVMAA